MVCKLCGKLIRCFNNHREVHHKDMALDELIYSNDERYTGKCLIDGCDNDIIFSKMIIPLSAPFLCISHRRGGYTLEKLVIKYGEHEGKKKWDSYCNKQSETNTFEYKQKKYGMTREEFDDYNSSRAVTLQNLIKKHGKGKGQEKWDMYCERQAYTNSLEYFIEKHGEGGEKIWLDLNKQKSQTLENWVSRYGLEEGTKKYLDYISTKRVGFYSKISLELFDRLATELGGKYYYGENEFGMYDVRNSTYYKYDFVDHKNKKVIEFNGERFHPKERSDPNFNNPFSDVTSENIWDRDINKKNLLLRNGYGIYYVWEGKYIENKDKLYEECKQFLKGND